MQHQKIFESVEKKDLNAFKAALNDPAVDVAIGSLVFERILKIPKSSEFMTACAEKGFLNAVRNYSKCS